MHSKSLSTPAGSVCNVELQIVDKRYSIGFGPNPDMARRESLIAQIKHPASIKKDLDSASVHEDAEGKSHDLSPGDFFPTEMDEGLERRKVVGILRLRADP